MRKTSPAITARKRRANQSGGHLRADAQQLAGDVTLARAYLDDAVARAYLRAADEPSYDRAAGEEVLSHAQRRKIIRFFRQKSTSFAFSGSKKGTEKDRRSRMIFLCTLSAAKSHNASHAAYAANNAHKMLRSYGEKTRRLSISYSRKFALSSKNSLAISVRMC